MSGKSLELDRGVCSELAYCLYKQKQRRLFCDIKINIGNAGSVYMHSCVLAAFSPCLNSLTPFFNNNAKPKEESKEECRNWSFKRPLEITLSPENDNTAKLQCGRCAVQFFDFLYIGKIKIEAEHVFHMEYLSSILQVEELLDACTSYRMEVDRFGKQQNNEFMVIKEARNAQQCKPLGRVNHEVKQTCAADPSTYFHRQKKTLATHEKRKVFRLNEKIQTFPLETGVWSRKVEKVVRSINPYKTHQNLQNGMQKMERPKFTANNVTQLSSVSKQENRTMTTFVKSKEVVCEEEDVIYMYEKKNVSPKDQEVHNLKWEGTLVHENSTTNLLSSESKLIKESIEGNMQIESHETVNHSEKLKFTGVNLTPVNISKREITLNTSVMNKTSFQDEKPTRSQESSLGFPPGKESSAFEEGIISNKAKDNLQLSSTASESNDTSDFNLVTKGYRCVCCNYFAESHYDLLKHMLISNHKKKTCSLCLYKADCWKTLSEHILQHNDPQPFFCSFCNERFETFCAQSEHISKHTGTVPCSCPICFDLFKSKHDLQRHMSVHKEGEIYVCRQCYFCSADKNEFNSHSLILCGGVFECSQPNCTFNTYLKCSLNDHRVVHTIQNSCLCELCGDTFSKTEDLQEHILKHEDNFNIFECSVPKCAFKTNLESSFKDHCVQHAPENSYLCKVCRDTFSSSQDLKEHAMKHEEKLSVFKCSHPKCAFQTNLECSFNAHCAQHSLCDKQSSYLCKVCGEKFSRSNDVQQHLLKHVSPNFPCLFCQFLGESVNVLHQHITECHPEVKCEIKKMEPLSIETSMVAMFKDGHLSITPKEPIKMVSNSSSNENCGRDKLELCARRNQAEVILPDTVASNYSCSNLLKKSVMDQKVNVSNVIEVQSFLHKRNIQSKQKQSSLPLVLNQNSLTNLPVVPSTVSSLKDDKETIEDGKKWKAAPRCFHEFLPIKKPRKN